MAMGLTKHSGDNLLDGLIFGALFGILLASTDVSWMKTFVDQIWNMIAPSGTVPSWLNWLGGSAKVFFFGAIGSLIGWAIDRF